VTITERGILVTLFGVGKLRLGVGMLSPWASHSWHIAC
jgi:hypothetical protein